MDKAAQPVTGGAQGQPRWYHGWSIVAALIVSQIAANCITYNSFPLFLKGWSGELHAPVSQFVASLSAMTLVAAIMSPIVGIWADRFPARWLFGIGLVGMGLFFIGVSLVTQAWQIVALYGLLAGPTLTMCTQVPTNALISRWFVRRVGLAMGLAAFGIGMGGMVFPPLVAHLLPLVGWRLIWRGTGLIIALVVMPLVVVVLRDRPGARDGTYYLSLDGAARPPVGHGHGHAVAGGSTLSWGDVFSRPNFWLLVAIYVLILGGGSAFVTNMGPFAAARGLDGTAAGLMLAAVGAAHVVTTLALGLASDRFGNRLPLVTLAGLVAVGLAAMLLGHTLPVLLVGAALIGMNAGVMTPLAAGIAAEFGPSGFGRAFGATMLFLPLAVPMGIVVARVQERTGSYNPALMVAIGAQVLAMVLALSLRERGRKGGAPAHA